jgi:hypothetical protein
VIVALLAGCEGAPPPVVTPPPSTPRAIPTLAAQPSVAVAVAVSSPTATPAIVGDYPVLVRDRLMHVESTLTALDNQFATLRQSPIRITEAAWRTETLARVDDVAAAEGDLRALGARSGKDAQLYSEVSKLLGDLDFVVSEYRMAFDFDPDGNHFTRAGRAFRMTSDEVQSMLLNLRLSTAPTLTPAPH